VSVDTNPALQQLGQRLSQARQACGLSLEEHADRLNMGREQLQALEAGNRDGLPEPVFVIAQARRVATSLGIQIDEEIAALRSSDGFQMPQASRSGAPSPKLESPAPAAKTPQRRSAALPLALLAVAILLVAAAALRGLQSQTANRSAPAHPSDGEALETPPQAMSVSPPAGSSPSPGQNESAAELVLQSSEPSWLEVRSTSGITLFRGNLEGKRSFPLTGDVEVLAGRPDLVQVRRGEGPSRAMGSIEDVRWRQFSSDPAPAP
jgi:cytoskeletal protein RodZ